ncbi:MAG: Fe-S cluster assembly ATPase SufC [Spirochaetia bacterium]|nr:Fe-S cluster assembly ATPase SufC [Spirochaetia bacterium]
MSDKENKKTILEISNLHAEYINPQNTTEKIPILHGINISIKEGEIHAIMGPNGSGKSTLSSVIMGHPHYKVTKGEINFFNKNTNKLENIVDMPAFERARIGLFLSFQYPAAVPGLPVSQFLRNALKTLRNEEISVKEFRKEMNDSMDFLKMDNEFAKRYLNEGFSGGEKKRMEILQMTLIKPALAVLDEIDSGLDIDALKIVSDGINSLIDGKRSFLLITHYKRLLDYVKAENIHVLAGGKIIKQGGFELVDILESKGYDEIVKEAQ